jgi:hypothetical protein
MLTDVTCARDVLAFDSTLRDLLTLWWTEKDIPVVVIDRLLDFGLERQADAVRWMLSQPLMPYGAINDSRLCRMSPIHFQQSRVWGWGVVALKYLQWSGDIPSDLFDAQNEMFLTTTEGPEYAICMALDAFRGPG